MGAHATALMIQDLQQRANAAFRAGDPAGAAALYTEALSACDRQLEPDEGTSEAMHTLLTNRAACRLRLQDHAGALQDARAALSIEGVAPGKHVKPLYRGAAALHALAAPPAHAPPPPAATQRLAEALHLLARAEACEPRNAEVQALKQRVLASMQSLGLRVAGDAGPTGQQEQEQQGQGQGQQQGQRGAARKEPLLCVPPELLLPPPRASVGGVTATSATTAGTLGQWQYVASPDGHQENVLLLLHGLGDTPAPYVALARKLRLPATCCLALGGPLEVPETGGGRAWFEGLDEHSWEPIQPTRTEQRRVRSLARTARLLTRLIDGLVAGGWAHRQISLLGFSQGGCAALEVHRRYTGAAALGGCVSIAGALLEETVWAEEAAQRQMQQAQGEAQGEGQGEAQAQGRAGQQQAQQGCGPVLITLGDGDEVTPRAAVDMTLRHLRTAHAPRACDLHTVAGKGHAMLGQLAGSAGGAGEARRCMEFWAANLARPGPTLPKGCVEVREGVCSVQRA